ncbi:multidrug and toxin extrusion protein 2-like [Heteronotia binoei]|uniref:multidrug and toxin extrusion protein 2-like n=1 Tax=Heteronotia binoei TaxID=13085 RepID=UPI00292CCFEB|nr:multidrug and toxin extrusion protein 2-like [Heteronotia binoei]
MGQGIPRVGVALASCPARGWRLATAWSVGRAGLPGWGGGWRELGGNPPPPPGIEPQEVRMEEPREAADRTPQVLPVRPSCWGRCGRRLRLLVPVGAWTEARELVKIGAPVFVAQLLGFLISVVSSIFCGHLGKAELDSVTLAVSVINVIGISVGTGLASVCDTLMSQTYGSRNVKRVGTILQRGILILLLFCFPCWAVFINTERILLLLGQDPEVSRLTQIYVVIFIPALPAAFIYQLQTRYLQSQAILLPQVVTGVAANILNVIMNVIFLYTFKLGVIGSAWANTLSQNTQALLLFFYVWWKKIHKETWGGWTLDCLQEWGSFMRLAIPSMLMMCIEWWTFEIGSFLSGMISVVELGAQSIIYELATVAYLLPQGMSVAASVRVGNALGAGDAEQAKRSCLTVLLCAGVFAVVFAALLAGVKDVVAYIFTNDKEIIALVSKVMIIFAPFHLLDAIAASCGGVLRGAGKQKMGAIANAVGYYAIGLPIGIALMFGYKLGVMGLWSGLIVCISLQAASFLIFVLRMDWKKAAEEAQVRAGLVARFQTAHTDDDAANKTVALAYLTLEAEVPNGEAISEAAHGSLNQPQQQLIEAEEPPLSDISPRGGILSGKELFFRRGQALVAAIAILVVGVLIRLLLKNG